MKFSISREMKRNVMKGLASGDSPEKRSEISLRWGKRQGWDRGRGQGQSMGGIRGRVMGGLFNSQRWEPDLDSE